MLMEVAGHERNNFSRIWITAYRKVGLYYSYF